MTPQETQTMSQHTEGPWKVSQIDALKVRAWVWTDRPYPQGVCVAEVRSETILESELAANARLIAAAPVLLAACKKAAEQYRLFLRGSEIVTEERALLAAIAQAEGRAA